MDKSRECIVGEMGEWWGIRYVATVASPIWKNSYHGKVTFVCEFGGMTDLLKDTEAIVGWLDAGVESDET